MRPKALLSLLTAGALLPLVLVSPASASGGHPGRELAGAAANVSDGSVPAVSDGFTVLGHSDLGGSSLNADVWGHRGYAYIGVWSGPCPATGVKVVDYRVPTAPQLVSVLQNDPGTSAEDVVVRRVRTPSFSGSLAVVGIQVCGELDEPTFRGLAFFDVTDPANPVEVGRWAAPELSVGCHEVDLVQRRVDGRVLAGCANGFAEQINGTDEVVLVDVTNPAAPVTAGGFTIGADLGVDPGDNPENLGCFPASFAHSVRFADRGRVLLTSYWDFGALRLDIADPASPRLVGRADVAPPDEDGEVHAVATGRGGDTLIASLEDFSPVEGCPESDGWGEAHLFDTDRKARPVHVGTFSTPNSRSTRTDGFFSIHNTEVARRTQAFSSWYSDGIVWWEFSEPSSPTMVGQWVPPAAADPTGTFPEVPLVWGVYLDRGREVVLASDMNSGLWILRPNGLRDL